MPPAGLRLRKNKTTQTHPNKHAVFQVLMATYISSRNRAMCSMFNLSLVYLTLIFVNVGQVQLTFLSSWANSCILRLCTK